MRSGTGKRNIVFYDDDGGDGGEPTSKEESVSADSDRDRELSFAQRALLHRGQKMVLVRGEVS